MKNTKVRLRYFYAFLMGVILITGAQQPAQAQMVEQYDLLIVTVDRLLNEAEQLATWKRQLGFRTKVISQSAWADPANSNIQSRDWNDPERNVPYSRLNINTVRQAITPYITDNGIKYLLLIGNTNDIMPVTVGNHYVGQFGTDTSRETDLYYATAGTISDDYLIDFTPVGPGVCYSGSYATGDCHQIVLSINLNWETVDEVVSGDPFASYADYLAEVNSWYERTQTNDYHPDVAYGRISVDTPQQLANVVDKIIDFEQYPTTSPDYYDNFVTVAQGVEPYTTNAKQVYWWLEAQGKNGAYYFANNNPSVDPDGFVLQTVVASDIIDAFEDSAFFIMHRDHGVFDGWVSPRFSTADAVTLQNTDLPFVFNMDCMTGDLRPDSFNQTMLNHFDGGAIASLGADNATDPRHNDFLARAVAYTIMPGYFGGITDMDVSPIASAAPSRIGDIVNTSKDIMELSEEMISVSNRIFAMTYYERYNLAGDPTVPVITSVPQNITASYSTSFPLGTTSMNVTAINVPSGIVTLVDASGDLVAREEFSGSAATLTFDPITTNQTLTLTISSLGYIPLVDSINFGGAMDFNFIATPNPVPAGQPVNISYTIPAAYDGADIRIIEHREWNDEIRYDYNQIAFSGNVGSHDYGPIWFYNKWYFGSTSGPYTIDLDVNGVVLDSLDLSFTY